jgi:tetratricopeptide (TPR) repeat protein
MDKELAAGLEKLRERMAELAKKLAERSSGPNDGFVNSMPGELSKSVLAEVQDLIAQGRFDEAMEKLREADEALAGLEESLGEESSEMAGGQEAEELMQALSEAIEDAKELEAQQEQVLKETSDLEEQFAVAGTEDQLAELREDIGELKEQVEQLRQGGTDPFVPTGAESSRVRSASFEVSGMELAMEEGMQDEAAAYAREAQAHLKDAARNDLNRWMGNDGAGRRRPGELVNKLEIVREGWPTESGN